MNNHVKEILNKSNSVLTRNHGGQKREREWAILKN